MAPPWQTGSSHKCMQVVGHSPPQRTQHDKPWPILDPMGWASHPPEQAARTEQQREGGARAGRVAAPHPEGFPRPPAMGCLSLEGQVYSRSSWSAEDRCWWGRTPIACSEDLYPQICRVARLRSGSAQGEGLWGKRLWIPSQGPSSPGHPPPLQGHSHIQGPLPMKEKPPHIFTGSSLTAASPKSRGRTEVYEWRMFIVTMFVLSGKGTGSDTGQSAARSPASRAPCAGEARARRARRAH